MGIWMGANLSDGGDSNLPAGFPTGAVLVVGGGVAGMQAALDLANGGFRVYLIDRAPAIGGTAARLDKIFPTNDCAMCMLSPRLAECSRHRDVEIITGAELIDLAGEPGCFTARVRQRARYVDLDRCTACGDCVPACPVRRPDAFNGELSERRAIYKLYPQGTPNAFAVERTDTLPCHSACPAGVRGSALAALSRERRLDDARRLLEQDNPFPGVCVHVCDRPCEAACPRGAIDRPVALADLVGFVAEQATSPTTPLRAGVRVAVVGAGPAGLTAAADLARLGSAVTVLEAAPAAGGALRPLYAERGAASDRLDREIAAISRLGVEIRVDCPVQAPEALLGQGYAAVVVATGPGASDGAGSGNEPRTVGRGICWVEPAPTVAAAIGAGHRAAETIRRFLAEERGALGSGDAERSFLRFRFAPSDRAEGGEGARLVPATPALAPTPATSASTLGTPPVPSAESRPDGGPRPDPALLGSAEASRCLSCGGCAECGACLEVCQPGAVDLAMADRELTLEVGAVVLAMGIEPFDARLKGEYGFGRYPNVLTSLQFERMLSASGPSGGKLFRPSNGAAPRRIAFLQCVGSRDVACGRGYCSEICCMFVAEEAVIAREHDPAVQPTVFYLDLRATGKGFERHVVAAERDHRVRYVRSMVSTVREVPGSRDLRVRYVSEDGRPAEEEFDLVVLAVGLGTPDSAQELCHRIGVEVDPYGFTRPSAGSPVTTSRPGVFAAGCAAGPKDIPAAMVEGSAAAAEAARLLGAARGTLTRRKEYPPERDVADEPPRIGVFVCRCGINIGGVVDVPAVAAFARQLPDVAHAEENLYTCSQDTLRRIREQIEELGLNRVVVAACTPRTHEPLYRETAREAGLNPFLAEMVNIREQDSWVHRSEPVAATLKAQELVAMAVARARLLQPIARQRFDVVAEALVVGGGLAGMTAALALANQGFAVCLVEREAALGGHLRRLRYELDGCDPPAMLASLAACVLGHQKIRTFTRATIQQLGGRVGRFSALVRLGGESPGDLVVTHGALIVAVGARAVQPSGYLYGEDPRVVTQTELEVELAAIEHGAVAEGRAGAPDGGPERVVMIQCVGSRTPERPYCGKVCCRQAVKNALKLKALRPDAEVYVLHRDVRTTGVLEEHFRRAREAGVHFLRYEPGRPPEVRRKGAGLEVVAAVDGRAEALPLAADRVVLSVGVAAGDHADLAARLKLPLTEDGFFLEAHPKLRPIDFAADGVFLCGLAHSPQTIPDVIAQATGAAARAATLLSQGAVESSGIVAVVDDRRCTGCGLCVAVCAYEARRLDEERRVAVVEEVLCQGCGACAVACPSGATRQLTLERRQVLAMLEV